MEASFEEERVEWLAAKRELEGLKASRMRADKIKSRSMVPCMRSARESVLDQVRAMVQRSPEEEKFGGVPKRWMSGANMSHESGEHLDVSTGSVNTCWEHRMGSAKSADDLRKIRNPLSEDDRAFKAVYDVVRHRLRAQTLATIKYDEEFYDGVKT
jgi:hypothetical protein